MTAATALRRLALLHGLALIGGIPLIAQSGAGERVRGDIEVLASDRFQGRRTGEPGADSAAAYIAGRMAVLTIQPLGDDVSRDCAGANCQSYLQHFSVGRALAANVVGLIPGLDSSLHGEYLVIGAHYDHLGHSPVGALDPEAKDAIRNGADDNASGVAALLELAQRFVRSPARRPVIFVAFTGEEQRLLGSRWFVSHAPVPARRIAAMINFDMVGRLGDGALQVHGTGTGAAFADLVTTANALPAIPLTLLPAAGGPSDQLPFVEQGVPVLHFFTGFHADYHRASDDVGRIDIAGEVRVIDLAERVIRAIADGDARITRQ